MKKQSSVTTFLNSINNNDSSKENRRSKTPLSFKKSASQHFDFRKRKSLGRRSLKEKSSEKGNKAQSIKSSCHQSPRCKTGAAEMYEKEHHYKSHTYRGFQWCEYCGNFMWGIIQQGVQCVDCGLNVHKQCSKLVPTNCQPALKRINHVFGVDLTTLVKLHGTQRPLVVDLCVEEIERRGMAVEGLYRVSGCHDDVVQVKADFDLHGPNANITTIEDINTVAGVLKMYLRELPVPLLPYQLYSRFINAAKLSTDDGKLDAFRMALSAMPRAHWETVKYLVNHLGRVSDMEHKNQMSIHNLGIVFGPTFLRPPANDITTNYNSDLNDALFQQNAVSTLIKYRKQLFSSK